MNKIIKHLKTKILPVEEKKYFFITFFIGATIAISDFLSKFLVANSFELYQTKIIIPNFFDIYYILNDGVCQNILTGQKSFLIIFSIIIFIPLVYYSKSLCQLYKERYFALALVLGGIIGNCIDRILNGGVIDFLYIHIYFFHSVFNIADMAISSGLGIYLLSKLFREKLKIK